MNTLLFKILNYESTIFNEYLQKRSDLLNSVKEININTLSKKQLLIFISDIKSIIDPVKTSIASIDYYFTNTDFIKDDTIKSNEMVNTLFYLFLLSNFSSSDDSEISEISESLDSLDSVT